MQFNCVGRTLSSFRIQLQIIPSRYFSYGDQIPRTLTEQIQFAKSLGIEVTTNKELPKSFTIPKSSSKSLVIALEGQIGVGKRYHKES